MVIVVSGSGLLRVPGVAVRGSEVASINRERTAVHEYDPRSGRDRTNLNESRRAQVTHD